MLIESPASFKGARPDWHVDWVWLQTPWASMDLCPRLQPLPLQRVGVLLSMPGHSCCCCYRGDTSTPASYHRSTLDDRRAKKAAPNLYATLPHGLFWLYIKGTISYSMHVMGLIAALHLDWKSLTPAKWIPTMHVNERPPTFKIHIWAPHVFQQMYHSANAACLNIELRRLWYAKEYETNVINDASFVKCKN